jgi:xylulokinase
MHKSLYILAHDLGTTGNKATLFDAAGATVATAFEAHETAYPHPNWAEQEPADWWRAVQDSNRELLTTSSVALGDMAVVSFVG